MFSHSYRLPGVFIVSIFLTSSFSAFADSNKTNRHKSFPLPVNIKNTPDVNVVNSPDVNVISMPPVDVTIPDTIDVNVQNTPVVNAQQQGPWSVNVEGLPGVIIENDLTNPVLVTIDPYLREPFQFSIQSAFVDASVREIFTVPVDKRLVIENVSLLTQASTENARFGGFHVDTTVGTVSGAHYVDIQLRPSPADGFFHYLGILQTRIYADPGTEVKLLGFANAASEGRLLRITVSGYLLPFDSPGLSP